MAFKNWLEKNGKGYHHDIFSEEIRESVNALYSCEWKPKNKSLLTLFTIYADYNLGTCCMKRQEIAFLIYQYLSFKIHFQKPRIDYGELKRVLTEEIDEEELQWWFHVYHELRLKTIDKQPNFNLFKENKNEH